MNGTAMSLWREKSVEKVLQRNHTHTPEKYFILVVPHKAVTIPMPTSTQASALLQVGKIIPQYLGYKSKPSTKDDSALREYIRLEWTNARNVAESIRTNSRSFDQESKRALDNLLTEFDVQDSDLRTSPTGEFARKIDGLKDIEQEVIDNLISMDLSLVGAVQSIHKSLLDLPTEPGEEFDQFLSSVESQMRAFRGKWNSRKSIIAGVPLKVIDGDVANKSRNWFQIVSLLVSILAIAVTVIYNVG
jgi:hypothetical protein